MRTLIPHTKINSKKIKDLNIRVDTIKFLKENTGRTFFDINHSSNSLDLSPKVNKSKNKQMGANKTKRLLHSKENHC